MKQTWWNLIDYRFLNSPMLTDPNVVSKGDQASHREDSIRRAYQVEDQGRALPEATWLNKLQALHFILEWQT